MNSVDFHKIEEGMTIHTFPEQKYVVFKHTGPSNTIPHTYEDVGKVFDKEGYSIKEGMTETEIVSTDMFGREETKKYEMEIWIPVK